MKTKYKHIHFVEVPKSSLGILWRGKNNKNHEGLGIIAFDKSRKQHVAQLSAGCVFNNQCLKDIADFLEQLNKEQAK